jgi:hypothetical protein
LTGFESDELFEDFDCLNRMGNEEMHQGKTSLHDPTKAKKRFKNFKLTHFISIGSYRKKPWYCCKLKGSIFSVGVFKPPAEKTIFVYLFV